MTFIVRGTYLDRPYHAIWSEGEDGTGVVEVPNNVGVEALLDACRGESFGATPTGPSFRLDPNDAASVLCALDNLTHIISASGDVPNLVDDSDEPDNTVY